ncbi:MAG: hypothetical protein EXR67_05350 [Dehalococcoidia bacterium]|nr:hypothetical protein [Dehalococcoidia bacterium]
MALLFVFVLAVRRQDPTDAEIVLPPPSAPTTVQAGPPASLQSSSSLININTGSLQELDTLPGIGPSLAQAIINYREQHGPLTRIEDLVKVACIGQTTFIASLGIIDGVLVATQWQPLLEPHVGTASVLASNITHRRGHLRRRRQPIRTPACRDDCPASKRSGSQRYPHHTGSGNNGFLYGRSSVVGKNRPLTHACACRSCKHTLE